MHDRFEIIFVNFILDIFIPNFLAILNEVPRLIFLLLFLTDNVLILLLPFCSMNCCNVSDAVDIISILCFYKIICQKQL